MIKNQYFMNNLLNYNGLFNKNVFIATKVKLLEKLTMLMNKSFKQVGHELIETHSIWWYPITFCVLLNKSVLKRTGLFDGLCVLVNILYI